MWVTPIQQAPKLFQQSTFTNIQNNSNSNNNVITKATSHRPEIEDPLKHKRPSKSVTMLKKLTMKVQFPILHENGLIIVKLRN